jgi:hypothetical protein
MSGWVRARDPAGRDFTLDRDLTGTRDRGQEDETGTHAGQDRHAARRYRHAAKQTAAQAEETDAERDQAGARLGQAGARLDQTTARRKTPRQAPRQARRKARRQETEAQEEQVPDRDRCGGTVIMGPVS